MGEMENEDLALKTFLVVADKLAPEVSKDLLQRVYALQKTHQFDRDRAVSLQEMQKLVEQYANALDEAAR